MATAGNSAGGNEWSAGAGGKFRKRPFRRNQSTPYDRPPAAIRPAQRNGWLSKLVDPATKLINAGAHKLFSSVFRKRLLPPPPSSPLQHPPDENQEMRDVQPETRTDVVPFATNEPVVCKGNDPSRTSDSNGVAELEDILKQKTFTRSEMDHLTAVLLSRTVDSSVGAGKGRSEPNFSDLQAAHGRHEKLTNFPVLENGIQRTPPGATSTPALISKGFQNDAHSPAEVAKAYMDSKPTRVSPSVSGLQNQMSREDLSSPYNSLFNVRSPAMSLPHKLVSDVRTSENGLLTPRFRGRSAIYSMARTPYSRAHPTAAFKAPETAFESSHNATESNQFDGSKKQVLKRRSSVLENDIGSVGPIRRIRQKPNLLGPKTLPSPASRGPRVLHGSGPLLDVDEVPSSLNLGSHSRSLLKSMGDNSMPSTSSGYVPSQSIQTAQKIFQQLDKFTPKGKSPEMKTDAAGGNSSTKVTPAMVHGRAGRSMETVDSLTDMQNVQNSGKENGSLDSMDTYGPSSSLKKFVVNSDNLVPQKGAEARMSTLHDSNATDNVVSESVSAHPRKKQAFQMSAHEDYLDLDDDVHVNGVASIPLNKGEDITELRKNLASIPNSPSLNEVITVERPLIPEQKPSENLLLSKKELEPLSDGPTAAENPTGFTFPLIPSSSIATSVSMQAAVNAPRSTSQIDKVAPENEANNALPVFSSKSDKLSSPLFSTSSSVLESAAPKETKLELPSSANDTTAKANGPDKIDYKTTQEVVDVFKKAENAPSTATTSAKAIFSFGLASNNATITNGLPSTIPAISVASSPILFSSTSSNQSSVPLTFSASSTPSLSDNASLSNGFAQTTPTSTTTAPGTILGTTPMSSSVFAPSVSSGPGFQFGSSGVPSTSATSGSVSALSVSSGPGFQFGSSVVSSTSGTSEANVGAKPTEKSLTNEDNKSNGIFGLNPFKSTSNEAQIPALAASSGSTSVFGFQTSSTAPISTSTPSFPSLFASSAPSPVFGLSGPANLSSGSSVFGFSTPAANNSSSSSGSSSMSATSIFGSSWSKPTTPGSTFGTANPSTGFSFGSTPGSSTAPVFSFSSAVSQPAASNPNPQVFAFGSTPSGNNDQMSMEDSMAEDSIQASTPTAPPSVFSQPPISATPSTGFMFGSPAPSTGGPFQFSGQPSQMAAQSPSPFQPSSSLEFNAGGAGSFSLGTGGTDKSQRRIVKVNKGKLRRK